MISYSPPKRVSIYLLFHITIAFSVANVAATAAADNDVIISAVCVAGVYCLDVAVYTSIIVASQDFHTREIKSPPPNIFLLV